MSKLYALPDGSQKGVLPTLRKTERYLTEAERQAKRRIEEREHLRLELNARGYIHTVHRCIDTLVAGVEEVEMEAGDLQRVPLDSVGVARLKAAMDGSLKLLDRVLPSLKAIEVDEAPELQMTSQRLTTTELMQLVQRMATPVAPPAVIEGEVVDDVPPWE